MQFSEKDIQRFWTKVDKSGDCWLWRAGAFTRGYGCFSVQNRSYIASRVSYFLEYGDFPDNLCVLHKCDTPRCVRPDHLFLGTNLDNIRDRHNKGRDACGDRSGMRLHPDRRATGNRNGQHTHPEKTVRGEKHYSARLTADMVRNIRALHNSGMCCGDLARAYDVSHRAIVKVINRISWKHVQ